MSYKRPSDDEYFMNIALAVRQKANCLGKKVGTIIVKDRRIISTGYNGTPQGMKNCLDGGCKRCSERDKFPRGKGMGLEVCICVHAEQNALLAAARFGISVEGSVLYTTMQPCFNCTKEMLQAKIVEVVYLHPYAPIQELQDEYEKLTNHFPKGFRKIELEDPLIDWAMV